MAVTNHLHFCTFHDNWQSDAILRAIHGTDGSPYFSVTDPAYRLDGGAPVADLDHNGKPEILARTENAKLICFEHDGTYKWIASGTVGRLAPAVADLDHDARPEIIVGSKVFNHDGSLRSQGAWGNGSNASAADLDLDGSPEVISGLAAYHSDGSLYWTVPVYSSSRVGVADFDADPNP